jgi:hypothetical protein
MFVPDCIRFFRSNCWRFIWALFLCATLVLVTDHTKAAELWDFIKVGKDYSKTAPEWEARGGKAQIEIQAGHLKIRAYYDDDPKKAHPEIEISGSVGADGAIKATCTILGTDANPFQLSGRYITRRELQIWGEKRKIVTHKEIVFPHPPNSDFYGFLSFDARDE